MHADTPERVIDVFSEHLNSGNLEGAMLLYEPSATFAPQPGETLTGVESIRGALEGFFALRPTITGEIQKVLRADDMALVVNKWSLRGTQPDGREVTMAGTSADVVRRQPDGRWLIPH